MRSLALTALLSTFVHAASLSGTLKTPDNIPLAGAGVSLAVAGLSTVTAGDGSWRLDGATGLARTTRTELRATRHLSVVNGRISLDWNGRDIAGRLDARTSGPKSAGGAAGLAGRSSGANVDTLLFTWRGARIGALPVDMDSTYDLQMRLDTSALPGRVQVRAVRNALSEIQGVSILLTSPGTKRVNSEPGSLNNWSDVHEDSLTLRFFVRSKDTLDDTTYFNWRIKHVPRRFKDAVSVVNWECMVLDSTGSGVACDNAASGKVWSWASLVSSAKLLPAERIDGSFDPSSRTWIYAIDAPLGPMVLPKGGMARLDLFFGARLPYPTLLSSRQKSSLDSLGPYLPGRILPTQGDSGWWDASTSMMAHPIVARDSSAGSLDWSFAAHSVRTGSPKEFPGLIKVARSQEADALFFKAAEGVRLWDAVAPNPYICVYRKGKLVSGYPPVPGRD
ncbi:MAG: hypothetical protein RL318_258 [Fibrobacterota bacterium]|jgi:hypothetical protein